MLSLRRLGRCGKCFDGSVRRGGAGGEGGLAGGTEGAEMRAECRVAGVEVDVLRASV